MFVKTLFEQRSQKNFLMGALLLLGIVLLAYTNVFRAGYIWDDEFMLSENPLIKAPNGLVSIWFSTQPADYFPLTLTSFWVEWRLWGANPGGYHVVNVVLHALGAILFWRVLRRLLVPGAWTAAAIFALHPVCVASVAWIAERKNTLSLFFFLSTILFWLRCQGEPSFPPAKKSKLFNRWYWLSFASLLLALLSKTSVVMLPLVLLLLAWWKRGRASKEDVLRSIPFFGLSLLLGLVTVWFQTHRAMGESAGLAGELGERILGGTWALWFYLAKCFLPIHLSMIYPRWAINPHDFLTYLPGVAWVGLMGLLWWKQESWGRGGLFILTYFTLMLLPVLGIFKMYFLVYSRVADHWQYLALLGLVAFTVGSVAQWAQKRLKKQFRFVAASAAIFGLGLLTRQQAEMYVNAETLWRDTLRKNPGAWIADNNLGVALEKKGEIQQAMFHYREALRKCGELKETFPRGMALPGKADAHYNVAKNLAQQGKVGEAIYQYEESLNADPGYTKAHNNLAVILEDQGKLDEAIAHYAEAVRLAPGYAIAQNNLCHSLLKKGKAADALPCGWEALRVNPDFAEAHYNVANALVALGKFPEAHSHFTSALRLRSDYPEAHYNLGNLFVRQKNYPAARAHFSAALTARPDFSEAQNNLGNTDFFLGLTSLGAGLEKEAATYFREAAQLRPGWREPANNLAWILATSHDDQLRNGPESLQLARHVVAKNRDAASLDTLAAALAESKNFPTAIDTAEEALKLAQETRNELLMKEISTRLQLYRAGQPFREPQAKK